MTPTPTLKMQECVLDYVPYFVEIFIIFALLYAVLFCRHDQFNAMRQRILNQLIGVIGLVSKQAIGHKAFDQCDGLLTICCCTFSKSKPDRHTMRIHGQMQFGVEPPFVRLIP